MTEVIAKAVNVGLTRSPTGSYCELIERRTTMFIQENLPCLNNLECATSLV